MTQGILDDVSGFRRVQMFRFCGGKAMKNTGKSGIRVWFCILDGKEISQSFARSGARTFARSFNKVMKGKAKCRIESRMFVESKSA